MFAIHYQHVFEFDWENNADPFRSPSEDIHFSVLWKDESSVGGVYSFSEVVPWKARL